MAVLALSLAGVGISIYLTLLHYAGVTPACPATGSINCEAVLSSSYAVIGGTTIPTSAAGIAWFAVCGLIAGWRAGPLHLLWSAVGLVTMLYLVFVELILVRAICLWCTAAHVLVVALLLLSLSPSGSNQMAQRAKARRPYRARRGGSG
jgi:uncharacterized membrane protein